MRPEVFLSIEENWREFMGNDAGRYLYPLTQESAANFNAQNESSEGWGPGSELRADSSDAFADATIEHYHIFPEEVPLLNAAYENTYLTEVFPDAATNMPPILESVFSTATTGMGPYSESVGLQAWAADPLNAPTPREAVPGVYGQIDEANYEDFTLFDSGEDAIQDNDASMTDVAATLESSTGACATDDIDFEIDFDIDGDVDFNNDPAVPNEPGHVHAMGEEPHSEAKSAGVGADGAELDSRAKNASTAPTIFRPFGTRAPNAAATFNPAAVYDDHSGLLKDWKVYRYTESGALMGKYTPKQIEEFLLYARPKKVFIIIGRSPTGSGRRFMDDTAPRCICSECPTYRVDTYSLPGTGRITQGDYMVSFDEFSEERAKGMNIDPFAVSGYMHLYCAERFIPALFNRTEAVEPKQPGNIYPTSPLVLDTRVLSSEPNGKNPMALTTADLNAYRARLMDSYFDEEHERYFLNHYPTPADFAKPLGAHAGTLTQAFHEAKAAATAPSVIKRYVARGVEGTQAFVHKGDLEVWFAAKLFKSDEHHYTLTYDQRMLLSDARRPYLRPGAST